jgi:hypothetical protein
MGRPTKLVFDRPITLQKCTARCRRNVSVLENDFPQKAHAYICWSLCAAAVCSCLSLSCTLPKSCWQPGNRHMGRILLWLIDLSFFRYFLLEHFGADCPVVMSSSWDGATRFVGLSEDWWRHRSFRFHKWFTLVNLPRKSAFSCEFVLPWPRHLRDQQGVNFLYCPALMVSVAWSSDMVQM